MKLKALAAAVLTAALIAPTDSALASESGTQWLSFACPSGSLMADQSVVGAGGLVSVPGVMDCGVPAPGPRFAVVVFEFGSDTGYYTGDLLKGYAAPEGPTRFTLYGFVMDEVGSVDIGLCLMTDERTRLSCIQVSPDQVVTQMSTSDPLVTKPIGLKRDDWDPNCSTCWLVP